MALAGAWRAGLGCLGVGGGCELSVMEDVLDVLVWIWIFLTVGAVLWIGSKTAKMFVRVTSATLSNKPRLSKQHKQQLHYKFYMATRYIIRLLRARKTWAHLGTLLKGYAPLFNHLVRSKGKLKLKQQ